ncbi:MAG: F0F1 ATP synthase subunit delta [Pseudomonadota bacterium]
MTASSPLSGVAERYASALFELSGSAKNIKESEKDLDSFEAAIEESADLERLIKSPVFSADDQFNAVNAILEKASLGEQVANFIRVVAKNRRLFALPSMIAAFRVLAAQSRGEVSADVTSAVALDKDQIAELSAALKEKIGKDVVLNQIVDPTILGGLVVKVGSQMIDTSVRTKLNSLKTMMKEVG